MEALLVIACIALAYVGIGVFGNLFIVLTFYNNKKRKSDRLKLDERPLYIFLRLLAINDTLACALLLVNVIAIVLNLNDLNNNSEKSILPAQASSSATTVLYSTSRSTFTFGDRIYVFYKKQQQQQLTATTTPASASAFPTVAVADDGGSGGVLNLTACRLYGPIAYIFLMCQMPAHAVLAFDRLVACVLPHQYGGSSGLIKSAPSRFCLTLWMSLVWLPVGFIMLLYWVQLIGQFNVLGPAAAYMCWARLPGDSSLRALWVMCMYIPLAAAMLFYLVVGIRLGRKWVRRWLQQRRNNKINFLDANGVPQQQQQVASAAAAIPDPSLQEYRQKAHGTLMVFVMFVVHVVCVLPLRTIEDYGIMRDDDRQDDGVDSFWTDHVTLWIVVVMIVPVCGKWILELAMDSQLRFAAREALGRILPQLAPPREDVLQVLRRRATHFTQQETNFGSRGAARRILVPSSTSNPFHETPTAIKLQPLIPSNNAANNDNEPRRNDAGGATLAPS